MSTLDQLTPGTIIILEHSYDEDGDGNRTATEWTVLEASPILAKIQSNKGIGYLTAKDVARITILRAAEVAVADIEPEAIQEPKDFEDLILPAADFDIEERLQPKPKKTPKGKKH